MYRAIFETIIKNMINFYQLILTTDFQKFENFQFWVEISIPNIS
jgi:hypothetical protein